MGMVDQAGVIWFGPIWACLEPTCTAKGQGRQVEDHLLCVGDIVRCFK